MNVLKKLTALLLVGLTMVTPVMANYTANYTIADVDDIFIDIIATGAVEVKSEMPTLIDLALLWIIMAMLVSIVALALGVFLVAPEQIKKRMGRGRR